MAGVWPGPRKWAVSIVEGDVMKYCNARAVSRVALMALSLVLIGSLERIAGGQPAKGLRIGVSYTAKAPTTKDPPAIVLRPNAQSQQVYVHLFNDGEVPRENLKVAVVDERTGIAVTSKVIAKLPAGTSTRINFNPVVLPVQAKDGKDVKDVKDGKDAKGLKEPPPPLPALAAPEFTLRVLVDDGKTVTELPLPIVFEDPVEYIERVEAGSTVFSAAGKKD